MGKYLLLCVCVYYLYLEAALDFPKNEISSNNISLV